jgi:hypothetical protein
MDKVEAQIAQWWPQRSHRLALWMRRRDLPGSSSHVEIDRSETNRSE